MLRVHSKQAQSQSKDKTHNLFKATLQENLVSNLQAVMNYIWTFQLGRELKQKSTGGKLWSAW